MTKTKASSAEFWHFWAAQDHWGYAFTAGMLIVFGILTGQYEVFGPLVVFVAALNVDMTFRRWARSRRTRE